MRYVIYLRVSTDQQADTGHSLAFQEEEARKWVRAHRGRIAGVYTDAGRSGADDIGNRPGLASAAAVLAEDKAEALLVYRLDRLARDVILQEQLLAELHRSGKELHSCSPTEDDALVHDPDDPHRKFVRRLLGLVAEHERDLIRFRMRRGMAQKAAAGGWVGGGVGYGYAAVRGQLVPVPEEQKAVRLMLRLVDQGHSYRSVCAELGRRGITPRRGGEWRPNTVHDIVRRERIRRGRAIAGHSPTPELAEASA